MLLLLLYIINCNKFDIKFFISLNKKKKLNYKIDINTKKNYITSGISFTNSNHWYNIKLLIIN